MNEGLTSPTMTSEVHELWVCL